MIKSLLDADENPPEGTKVIIEETTINAPADSAVVVDAADTVSVNRPANDEDVLERSPPAVYDTTRLTKFPETPLETANAAPVAENFTENFAESPPKVENPVGNIDAVPFQSALYEPESQAETARKSGLAYAAGITLFAAVVFMMIIGWGADLLLGTSPWGIVGGIVLGALVGFVQFFRLTSQILKNKD